MEASYRRPASPECRWGYPGIKSYGRASPGLFLNDIGLWVSFELCTAWLSSAIQWLLSPPAPRTTYRGWTAYAQFLLTYAEIEPQEGPGL